MVAAHHDDVPLVQQEAALDVGQRGNVAEREVDATALHRRQDVDVVELECLEPHTGSDAGDPRHQRRQEDRLADVAHVQAERPMRARRIVRVFLAQRGVEPAERLLDRGGEPLPLRRRGHPMLGAHEQRVAKHEPQPPQRVADGRLRHAEPLGGARDVAGRVHRVEGLQQVEVELPDVHSHSAVL